jgi:TonB family protein
MPVALSGSDRSPPQDLPRSSAAPSVDADRAFDALARAQLLALSRGNGGGLAGAGSGRGGIGVGLATQLSGRHDEHSPVVNAPVIVAGRPVECELPEALNLRAVVRVLVTRDGSPAVPRLLRSSGHERFDRCALAYVLAARFAPGTNERAEPLDVWMNVQVAPITANHVGSAM